MQAASTYASPYSLVKQPVYSTPFETVYKTRNKKTNQVWYARVIHHSQIDQYGLEQHLGYNEEAMMFLNDKPGVAYVTQIFYKNDDTYLVQQQFKTRLSEYLEKNGPLSASETGKILRELYMAACDIYEEGYVHRSIRPEHVVLIENQKERKWKIDTLVYDNKGVRKETPYTWLAKVASPEQKKNPEALTQAQTDAQIVWNFGYLAVQMLLGNEAVSKMDSQRSVNWNKIKTKASEVPILYEMIEKCFRFNVKQRISVNGFTELALFKSCGRKQMAECFGNASMAFKSGIMSQVQRSVNMKSMNLKSMNMKSIVVRTPKPIQMRPVEKERDKNEEEAKYEKGNCLMAVGKYADQLQKVTNSSNVKENRLIIEFFFRKLAGKYLADVQIDKGLKEQSGSQINAQSKIVKRIKPSNQLLSKFSISTTANHTLADLTKIFNQLCGYAYSRLTQKPVKQPAALSKAISYFVLAAFMVNNEGLLPLDRHLPQRKGKTYLQAFEKQSVTDSVEMSRYILNTYFMTDSA